MILPECPYDKLTSIDNDSIAAFLWLLIPDANII